MGKLLISKDGFKVQEIELKSGTITVGRAKDNDIQLNDPTVSSHHAKIVTVMHNSYIEDLDSKNGVFINGVRTVVQALESDDVLSIGQHELFFQEAHIECAAQDSLSETAVASVNVGSSSKVRDASTVTAIPQRNVQQQSTSTSLENSLRIVVDNTFKSSQPRPLDIDISFEKFVSKSVSLDGRAEALNRNGENVARSPYIETYRYFESPREIADRTGPSEHGTSNTAETSRGRGVQDSRSQQLGSAISKQTEKTTDEGSGSFVDQQDNPAKPVSKQPFMSSEEVVQHLIALGREKNKSRKRPHGLSSLITLITFGLIAAAIYFQLQLQ
ncbi:FHA domain-containing protein [Kaarinaea lacus]